MSGKLKIYALAALMLTAAPISTAWAAPSETYATLHDSEPALAAGNGRLYFYRESGLMGVAIQPTVMINGQSAGGRAKPGDYFYVDMAAGSYEISTETEKKEAITATIAAGQSMYIRFDVSMGFMVGHVNPSIIDPQQAVTEIKDCDFHAPKPVEGATAAAPAAPAQAPAAPAATATAAPATTASAYHGYHRTGHRHSPRGHRPTENESIGFVTSPSSLHGSYRPSCLRECARVRVASFPRR